MCKKVYSGFTYELSKVIDTGGADSKLRAYVLETGGWDDPTRFVNLGRRRYIHVRGNCYLVFVSEDEIKITELKFDDSRLYKGHPVITITDVLKGMGIKCKIIADYESGTRAHGAAWKRALNERQAIFAQSGYALQKRFWCDCWEVNFDMVLVKHNWFLLDGAEVRNIGVDLVLDDIMNATHIYIERILSEPISISRDEAVKLLKLKGIEESTIYDLVGKGR
ncbi:MAG: hypothetical protein IJ757_06455 [Clostridiales bacterium]|nr:hypothetical protein [Clostridiales bacterium]